MVLGAVREAAASNWMTGKTDPKLRELAALARLFGVSVDYLVKDELEEPGGDGLGEVQRRVLWAAETVGYDVALRRIMKAPVLPMPGMRPKAQLPLPAQARESGPGPVDRRRWGEGGAGEAVATPGPRAACCQAPRGFGPLNRALRWGGRHPGSPATHLGHAAAWGWIKARRSRSPR